MITQFVGLVFISLTLSQKFVDSDFRNENIAGMKDCDVAEVSEEPAFYWYLSFTDEEPDLNSSESILPPVTFHAWVYDCGSSGRHKSSDETKRVAIEPGEYSKYLTRQFWRLGQRPVLILLKPGGEEIVDVDYQYNETMLAWRCQIEQKNINSVSGQKVVVSGRSTALFLAYNIKVSPFIFAPYGNPYQAGVHILDDSDLLVLNTFAAQNWKNKLFSSEACKDSTILFTLDDRVIVTVAQFANGDPWYLFLKKSSPTETDLTLKHAVPFYMCNENQSLNILALAIVTESKIRVDIYQSLVGSSWNSSFWRNTTVSVFTLDDEILEDLPVEGVAVNSWLCDNGCLETDDVKLLFWTNKAAYLSDVYLNNTYKLTIVGMSPSADIKDASFIAHVHSVAIVLLDRAQNKVLLAVVNYIWMSSSILYEWEAETCGNSVDAGIMERIGSEQLVTKGVIIWQLIINKKNEVICSLSNRELLYSMLRRNRFWTLGAYLNVNPTTWLWFDYLDVLTNVKPYIHGYIVNVAIEEIEFESKLVTYRYCPYSAFSRSDSMYTEFVTTLDRHDTAHFSFTVYIYVPIPPDYDPEIIEFDLSTNGEDLISVAKTLSYAFGKRRKLDEVLTFSVANINETTVTAIRAQRHSVGFLTKVAKLDDQTKICPPEGYVVGEERGGTIIVGCPPTKQLTIKDLTFDPDRCPDYSSGSYTYHLNGNQIRNFDRSYGKKSLINLVYDFKKLGCPMPTYQNGVLRPTLLIAGNDAPLEVDYVIFEEYRRDFSYLKTLSKTRCSGPAQSWKTMASLTNSTNPFDIWNPTNYKSCNKSHGVAAYGTEQYEIMHASDNGLLFTNTDNRQGIYIFTASIVDPEFSFCNLTVTFGVDVYGPQLYMDLRILWMSLGIAVPLVAIALTSAYMYYTHYIWRKFITS